MSMLNTGMWSSSFRTMAIKFNENVWSLIPSAYDESDGAMFGVIDNNDGSSFIIDVSEEEESYASFDYEVCADEYFSRLFNADNSIRELDRFDLVVDDISFSCILYKFNNANFGEQFVMRGMHIGETEAVGISIAWPFDLKLPLGMKVPPKFKFFLKNFSLKTGTRP